MEKMDEKEIQSYVDSGEGDDKAAAYAIQGKGSLFIEKIDGDYFNVVGLPIYTLKKLLKEFGISCLWNAIDKIARIVYDHRYFKNNPFLQCLLNG